MKFKIYIILYLSFEFFFQALLYFIAILQVWNRIRFNTERLWSLQSFPHYASVYHELYIVKWIYCVVEVTSLVQD